MIKVILAKYFLHDVKQLRKKYRNIIIDVDKLRQQLLRGETPGDRVQGVSYVVYKVRVQNTDAKKGKSGGYRVLYYVKTEERLILLTIYAKSEQIDISAEIIKQIIEETLDDETNGNEDEE